MGSSNGGSYEALFLHLSISRDQSIYLPLMDPGREFLHKKLGDPTLPNGMGTPDPTDPY